MQIQTKTSASAGIDRRIAVMDSALATFARFGYRKTSMEEIARWARISRPGLYFLFASKELFRAAVAQALTADIAAVERILGQPGLSLHDKLLDAFGQWAGRYIGPLSRDIGLVIEDNPEFLDKVIKQFPRRFMDMITTAIAASAFCSDPKIAVALAQTLVSTSIGLKHQVVSQKAYLERFKVALNLLLR